MDPEPGRCRRTDGKQWRCRREVVPDQKYCERHMHRGSCSSRKHVEASEINSESVPQNLQIATPSSKSSGNPPAATPHSTTSIGSISKSNISVEAKKKYLTAAAASPTNTLTIDSNKRESNKYVFGKTTTPTTGPRRAADDKNSYPIFEKQPLLQLATPPSKSSVSPPAATPSRTTSIGSISKSNIIFEAKKKNLIAAASSPTTTLALDSTKSDSSTYVFGNTTTTTTGPRSAANDKNNNCVDGKDAGYKKVIFGNSIIRSFNNRESVNAGISPDSGFGFSSENVLHGSACCYSSSLDYKKVEETESLLRCKRTDGKKWRCNWDVVPDQKYCQRHLHRGSKKLAVAAQSVMAAATPPPPLPLAIPLRADQDCHVNLNTNLSISISGASPQQTTNEEKRSHSSSSDATTVTDENGSVSHLLALSP